MMVKTRILLLVLLLVLCCEFQLTSGKKGWRKRMRNRIKAVQKEINALSKTLMKFMLDTEERFMRNEKAIQCLKYPNGCPNCEPKANCLVDPCENAVCNGYPGAICKANYCGGCNTEWTLNGVQVTCKVKEPGK